PGWRRTGGRRDRSGAGPGAAGPRPHRTGEGRTVRPPVSASGEAGEPPEYGWVGMKTLVVLPTYNESATIAEVLRRIRASAVDAIDVLVVDDSSPDGTADLAEALAAELGGIEVLRRPHKAGLG